MNVFIVVTGLFMILDPPGSDQLEILFLKSGGYQLEFEKRTYTFEEHPLRVLVGMGMPTPQTLLVPTEPVELGLLQDTLGAKTTFENPEGLLDASEILPETCRPTLRPGCWGPNALATCRNRDRALLAGRLTLSGGSLRPVEVGDFGFVTKWAGLDLEPCTKNAAVTDRPAEEELWSFKTLAGNPPPKPFETRTFNGIVYGIKLDDPTAKETTFAVGSSLLKITPSKNALCGQLQAGLKECVLIHVSNAVVDDSSKKEEAGSDHYHGSKTVDLHFALNFEVLQLPDTADCPITIPVWSQRKPEFPKCVPEPGMGSRCAPLCACPNRAGLVACPCPIS